MFDCIMALILTMAAEVGIPPYFVLAIAMEENKTLDPLAVSPKNENGTVDLGVMQLNSQYYGNIDWSNPITNIRIGCLHIKALMEKPELTTYWAVAVAFNCGYWRFVSREGPPISAIDYGCRVMDRWCELAGMKYINPVIKNRQGRMLYE